MLKLFWDVENLPSISQHWRFFNETIAHDNIIENQSLVSIAWRFSNEKKVNVVSSYDKPQRFKRNIYDDEYITREFLKVLNRDEDFILVGHNADRFDMGKFRTACIKYNLDAPYDRQSVDTLKIARSRFKFESNRLDYLCRFLGIGTKIETGGMQLWRDIVQWKYPEVGMTADYDKAVNAIKKMCRYNKHDVALLEPLYDKLRPYIKNHPNAMIYDHVIGCKHCGSKNYIKKGYRPTNTGRHQRYKCNDCNSIFTPPASMRKYFELEAA